MTTRCRSCLSPDPSAPGCAAPATRTSLVRSTVAPKERFRVVVLAGSPSRLPTEYGDPNAELDWQEAVVALAVAVIERGGTLTTPANPGLVNVLAQAAIPHAQPHPAEGLHESAPIEAVETGGPSVPSRRLLAPFAHRNCLTLLSRDRDPVPMTEMPAPTEADGELLRDAPHHPFARELMSDALGAVVIHPDTQMTEEMIDLMAMEAEVFVPPRVAVVGSAGMPADVAGWARQHDPVGLLLGPESDTAMSAGPVPYALVMELLVDSWLE